jgi:hypothetical protein
MTNQKQLIGIISPNQKSFKAFISEQLPEHPKIKYKRITTENDIIGRFTKVVNGYGYHEVNLEIRLRAYKRGQIINN